MSVGQPYPDRDQLVERSGKATREFDIYLTDLENRLDRTSSVQSPIVTAPAGGNAGQVVTPIGSTFAAGFYRLSEYIQILTPGGVSGDVQLVIRWIFNGVTQTKTFPLVNGNTTTTFQSDGLPLFEIDGGVISYEILYNSNPAGGMVYDLTVMVEAMGV